MLYCRRLRFDRNSYPFRFHTVWEEHRFVHPYIWVNRKFIWGACYNGYNCHLFSSLWRIGEWLIRTFSFFDNIHQCCWRQNNIQESWPLLFQTRWLRFRNHCWHSDNLNRCCSALEHSEGTAQLPIWIFRISSLFPFHFWLR